MGEDNHLQEQSPDPRGPGETGKMHPFPPRELVVVPLVCIVNLYFPFSGGVRLVPQEGSKNHMVLRSVGFGITFTWEVRMEKIVWITCDGCIKQFCSIHSI